MSESFTVKEWLRPHQPEEAGMTPNECWELLIGRVERRTVRIEDLRVVFILIDRQS